MFILKVFLGESLLLENPTSDFKIFLKCVLKFIKHLI